MSCSKALSVYFLAVFLPGISQASVSPEALDFGRVPVGSCEYRTLTVQGAVEIERVLSDTQQLSLMNEPVASGPDFETHLRVRFCAESPGTSSGALRIETSAGTLNVPAIAVAYEHDYAPKELIVEFEHHASGFSLPSAGPLAEFGLPEPLAAALENARVTTLKKVFRQFSAHELRTSNALGEDVLLTDVSRFYVVELDEGSNVVSACSELRDAPGVRYVAPNYLYQFTTIPNDPLFVRDAETGKGGEWWLHNDGTLPGSAFDTDINAPEAWEIHRDGSGGLVAVIDSGADLDHEDLVERLEPGTNITVPGASPEDDLGHGTAVSGVIAASGNNGTGSVGVSWNARVLPVKANLPGGFPTSESVAAAIDFSRTAEAHIANMSLGGPEDLGVFTATRNASLSGVLQVAAMGNDNEDDLEVFPAAHRYTVFAVGALWLNRDRWDDSEITTNYAEGSNTGSWIDVTAPGGRGIVSAKRANDYFDLDPGPPLPVDFWDGFGGTSAATAVVSGAAALLRSYHQSLSSDDLAEILSRTTVDITQYGAGHDPETGFGLIRADAALRFVSPPHRAVEQRQLAALEAVETVQQNHTFFGHPDIPDGTYPTTRYRLRGTHTFESGFVGTPDSWVRNSGTIGWSAKNPYEFVEDPPAYATTVSVNSSSITCETFVYEVRDIGSGSLIGWFPSTPEEARIALTAIGNTSPVAVLNQAVPERPVRILAAPNPARGRAQLLLNVSARARGLLQIYDATGRLVATLLDGQIEQGQHRLLWNGQNSAGRSVSRGAYFYRLSLNGREVARDKVMLTR